jgi:hypothetical protein
MTWHEALGVPLSVRHGKLLFQKRKQRILKRFGQKNLPSPWQVNLASQGTLNWVNL